MEPNMDFLNFMQGAIASGQGSVAQRLLGSGFNVNALRPLGALRKDEWILYDTKVIEIARERLGAIQDLLGRGLRYPLNNAMGTTRIEWERGEHMEGANISMAGVTQTDDESTNYELLSLPVPIVHRGFSLNIRQLEASRTTGQALDTRLAGQASRVVSEKIEGLLFEGSTISQTQGRIYGLRNAPERNTGSLTASWMTATGEQIVDDVLKMINALVGNYMYGPYMLYVSQNVMTRLGEDYKANSDKTVLQRLREIEGISGIRASHRILDTEVITMHISDEVVDIVDGFPPTMVQWDSHGGMMMHFKVMSIMFPRVRADMRGQSGIAHFSS